MKRQVIYQTRPYYKKGSFIGPKIIISSDGQIEFPLKRFLSQICQVTFSQEVIKRFRKIEIVFALDRDISKQGSHETKKGAWVTGSIISAEIAAGINRIYIFPDNLKNWIESGYTHVDSNPNLRDKILKETIEEMGITIAHEATHIFQDRVNNTEKLIIKNVQRLDDSFNTVVRNWKLLFDALQRGMAAELKKDKKNTSLIKRNERRIRNYENRVRYLSNEFGELWIYTRKILTMFIWLIHREGMANFYAFLLNNKINWSNACLKSHYAKAYRLSIGINKKFGRIYTIIIVMYKNLKQIGNLKTSKDEERQKSLAEENKRLFEKAEKLIDEITGRSVYDIGLHIYHMVLFADENKSIDRIARLNYKQLFKEYEKACSQFGFQPVFTLSSKAGVFSYRKHVLMLTRLRRMIK